MNVSAPPPDPSLVAECAVDVPPELADAGLELHRDFVTAEEEQALMAEIDDRPWDSSVRRRTQHYGRRFDYQRKTVASSSDPSASSSELPPAVGALVARLRTAALPWAAADADDRRLGGSSVQVTVNEYVPGVGIAAHVDTHSAFHDGIVSLSLGGGIAFRLQHRPSASTDTSTLATASTSGIASGGRDVSLWLPPRSLLVLAGASRYDWHHGIAGRKYDRVAGVAGDGWVARTRRVSVTVRRVLPEGSAPAITGGRPVELPTRLG